MNKRTLKSIIILGMGSVISYIITFFLTEFITEKIGIEAFGFVSIAKSFVSYAGIVTVSLTSFVVRYITIHYHNDEIDEAKSFFVSSINASLFFCLILAMIFGVIILFLEHIIVIPIQLVNSVKLLFGMVFIAFVSTTISVPFSTSFYIKNRLDVSGVLKICSYLLELIILLLLFSFFAPSLWFVGIGSITASATILIGSCVANKKLTPEFSYDRYLYSKSKVKILIGNGLWNSVNQLGNTLNSGLDLLVANALLSGIETGQIAVAKSIGTIFGSLAAVFFQPLQPELLRTYSEGVSEAFLNQLKKSMKICGLIGSLAFSGFFGMGVLFYKLWLPSQNCNILSTLTILTVFTYIMDIFLQPVYYVNTLTVKNKIPCFVTIVGGLINVVAMYFLIKYTNLGVYAVPITTVVIMLLINLLFNPIYASWCLKISKTYFYPLVIRHIFATVIISFTFKGINLIIAPYNWGGLILTAIGMCVIGAVIYIGVTFNKDEIRDIIIRIKRR